MGFPSESPFSKSDIKDIDSPFTKRGSHVAFRMANGQVLINFSDGTHHSVLADIARTLSAELVSVTGTWTFTPDAEQEYKAVHLPKKDR
jgi:hypothetical protein